MVENSCNNGVNSATWDSLGEFEKHMTLKKAFTLIELLVVIAIIAILAAILFPVFAQAKAAAKKAATLSNIKQNGTAVMIYLSDNDDTFAQSAYCQPVGTTGVTPNGYVIPGSGCQVVSVYDAILPYTKNRDIFNDVAEPAAVPWSAVMTSLGLRPNLADIAAGTFGANAISVAGMTPNFALFEDPAVPPNFGTNDPVISQSQLEFSADTTMFACGRYIKGTLAAVGAAGGAPVINPEADPANPIGASNTAGVQQEIINIYRAPGAFSGGNFPGTARHSEQIIINFADGHAKSFKRNARFPNLVAPDPFNSAAGVIRPVYNLPFDINGIPNYLAESRA